MKKTLKNLYVTFPLVGIFLVILNAIGLGTILDYHYPTRKARRWGNKYLLEKFDISGMTEKFLIFFTLINLIVLLYCFYKGKQSLKTGWNYSENKKIVIIFLILTIIPFFAFLGIRNQEEMLSLEIGGEEIVDYLNGEWTLSTNKNKSDTAIITEKIENEKFYARKLQIRREMLEQSTVDRFLEKYIYRPRRRMKHEERYYAIFSKMTIINIIFGGFYFMRIGDETKKMKTDILVRDGRE